MPSAQEKVNILIKTLLNQTERGLLQWSVQGPLAYRLMRESGGVRLFSKDNDGMYPYVLQILDSNGAPVESFEVFAEFDPETDRMDPNGRSYLVGRLWELARDSALQITPILDNLLQDLGENDVPF